MPKEDILIHFQRLLAQELSGIEGEEIYHKTSCLSPEEAEIIGIFEGLKFLGLSEKQKQKIDRIVGFLEMVGKAKWVKGELTNLGLRVGNRFTQKIDVAQEKDIIDATRGANENAETDSTP